MAHKTAENLSSGMYLLTTREGDQNYGCLINSAMEVSRKPARIAVCLVKTNLTHEALLRTGIFNLSLITEDAPYELYRQFGMKSGRKTDKFTDCPWLTEGNDGIPHLKDHSNGWLSAHVTEQLDLGDHTLFIGQITGDQVLNDLPTCTFDHFLKLRAPSKN